MSARLLPRRTSVVALALGVIAGLGLTSLPAVSSTVVPAVESLIAAIDNGAH